MEHGSLLQLAIHEAMFLHTHEKQVLESVVRSERFFRSLSVLDLSRIVGRPIRSRAWDPQRMLDLAARRQTFLEHRGIDVLHIEDSSYPPQLREIFDPPYVLFLRGNLPSADIPATAIVGTRKPSDAATEAARSLAYELGTRGLPVVSGLAYGIDAAAARGTLEAGAGGVAVLGTGIDAIYPARHAELAACILRLGGAILSEYAPYTPTRAHHFPARNRIISGLARWTVVVQAPERSGALITADYALEQGRELVVHAAGLNGRVGSGTSALAEDGAPVISNAQELLSSGLQRPRHADQLDLLDDAPAYGGQTSQKPTQQSWYVHEGAAS